MMDLLPATELAEAFVRLLLPACNRVEIAGSIRREKPTVKDIEIVAHPLWDTDPLTFPPGSHSRLDNLLDELVWDGVAAWDTTTPRNGLRYKRLVYQGMAVDLFLTDAWNWGNIFLIRTGDAAFSRLCVTQRTKGGLLPNNYTQREGHLYCFDEMAACREEQDVFNLMGIPFVRPQERNEETAQWLRKSSGMPVLTPLQPALMDDVAATGTAPQHWER